VSFSHSVDVAGIRQPSDRHGQGWNQPDGPKQSQKPVAGPPSDPPAGGGGGAAAPGGAGASHGAEFSPSSDGKSGRGGGQLAPAGASKTIQSYFYKPSNGTAVQNLAASYGAGELGGQARAVSGLPQEVDLSGADGDSCRGEPSNAQPIARIGRSDSTGGGDGRSLQHRFSSAVSSAGDGGFGQPQQGHQKGQSRAQAVALAGGGGGSSDGTQAESGQESVEKLQERLREAKAVEAQLRKELARANLERGSMETMVGRARYCVAAACLIHAFGVWSVFNSACYN